MWLILTDTGDPEGHWLADGLSPRLPGPIVHLTGRDLVEGCRWEHRFDDQGEWFRLYTATGVVVDNRNVRGVINRLRVLPAGTGLHRRFASRGDEIRDTGAMLLSCLSTFTCPVLNPPGAHGVSGDQRSVREWAALAQRAGFRSPEAGVAPVGGDRNSGLSNAWEDGIRGLPLRHLLVVGQRILSNREESALPEGVAACCRRLAAFARCPLLAIQLVQTSPNDWTFRSANAHPALLSGGLAVLDAIAAALGPTLVASTRGLAAKPSTSQNEESYQSDPRSVPITPGAQWATPAVS